MQVRTYRKIHRYLGLVVGVQLLLWTGSGLFFALNPIEKVRGETEQTEPHSVPADLDIASPGAALDELIDSGDHVEVLSVLLRPHLDGSVYEISYRENGATRWAMAEASSGELREPAGRDEAVALARRDFAVSAEIAAVDLLTDVESDSEYRGGPLPAYRVAFDHPLGTNIYVSSDRGRVMARRNDRWRQFDFLWMFHIMDYNARDNFNTVVLQLASALGLVTVLSGFVLAGVTSPKLRGWLQRRRK